MGEGPSPRYWNSSADTFEAPPRNAYRPEGKQYNNWAEVAYTAPPAAGEPVSRAAMPAQGPRNEGQWSWDPSAPLRPEFAREQGRVTFLQDKQRNYGLTPSEQRELSQGYNPQMYQGSTFAGNPVKISGGDRNVGGAGGAAYITNDPAQWQSRVERIDGELTFVPGTAKPFSVKNYPQGPPGWQPLSPGQHYSTAGPQNPAGVNPWDVDLQRMLNEGTPAQTQGLGANPYGFKMGKTNVVKPRA